jgi:UDP-glucose:(heptosyl)LPS alpha-1,3-glucosyltransferase
VRPLRIAILKNSFHAAGGLEKSCRRLCDALQRRGHTVTILSTASCGGMPDLSKNCLCAREHKDTSSSEIDIVRVCRRLRPSALNLLWFDLCCRRYLKRHPHDVVFGFDRHFLPLTHYRAGNGCHAAYLARRSRECGLLKRCSFFFNPLHRLTLLSEKCTFEKHPPRFIICNSSLVRNEILSLYPKTPQDRVVVVHNGVEWYEYEDDFRAREPSGRPRLFFIGHEWERKGLDRLLRALAFVPEPFHLTAVGRERHPSSFASLVQKLGLQDKVTLIPQAQNPRPYYRTSDIIVIPSRYDPFANVTLEALAMGLFVVTTRANGGSEAIITGENGIVLDEDEPDRSLGRAISLAIQAVKDPQKSSVIRQTVKNFDFSNKLKDLVGIVEE